MREWSREEKYRYLKDPQELIERYRRISASAVMRPGVRLPWTGER